MTYYHWLGGESEELLLTGFVGYAQQPRKTHIGTVSPAMCRTSIRGRPGSLGRLQLSLAALYAQQAWRQMTTQPYWPGSLDQGLGRLGGFKTPRLNRHSVNSYGTLVPARLS